MNNLYIAICLLIITGGCTNKNNSPQAVFGGGDANAGIIADSLLYFRHHARQTDLLSRYFPTLSREKAIAIQLAMLKKELDAGAHQVGWKMGGTIATDSAGYNPVFGYILQSNIVQEDSVLLAKDFPAGSINVEGEIGFLISRDFENGARSLKELKKGISYVVNAVELAKTTAASINSTPDSININYNIAAGMGQVGTILGSGKTKIEAFHLKNEIVKCFINDTLAAKGVSANVYGGPLKALYSLANMLPKYGTYLKKGQVVITGSVYPPPLISSTSNVRVKSSTLGAINFQMD